MTQPRTVALEASGTSDPAGWSSTPLGPADAWSPALRNAATLLFATRQPAALLWGPRFLCLMNQPARALHGAEPPTLDLVAPAEQAWPQWWQHLQTDIRSVLDRAAAVATAEAPLPGTFRRFAFTCCPMFDPAAPSGTGGVLVLFQEPAVDPAPETNEPRPPGLDAARLATWDLDLGSVAHDFNNLLGAMVGSFELIRRRHDDPERVRQLAAAGLLVAERGAKLTSQLLALSRAQHIELTAVSVTAVLGGMHEMLPQTVGPGIDVAFDISCGDCFVLSDPTQLELAILNLAINARDAMLEGGRLTIAAALRTIERHDTLAPGEYVELMVQDTGTGMAPEIAARAFDPFFTTKGNGKGSGLGLSQVDGLARQAGGVALIESRPGHGATIRLLLPCTDAPPAIERPAQAPPDHHATPDVTVLLVDDDHDLRSVLAASLRDLGYEVLEAADGEIGLRLLEQHEPDLLVADFSMPGMTGAELARSARALRPNLPIIFASGYAEALQLDTAIGPAPRVLRKPFRIGELQAEIDAALSHPG